MSTTQYNSKDGAVRRIMQEIKEMSRDHSPFYKASPLEENLFEWHFTIRGQNDTDYAGGIYHGRIVLPARYPLAPPHIYFLTPNGRFQVGEKICLSISGFHPEQWLPAWSIRTVLVALISFMPSPAEGAIGALEYPPIERQKLAKTSRNWCCDRCGSANANALPELESGDTIPVLQELSGGAKLTVMPPTPTPPATPLPVAAGAPFAPPDTPVAPSTPLRSTSTTSTSTTSSTCTTSTSTEATPAPIDEPTTTASPTTENTNVSNTTNIATSATTQTAAVPVITVPVAAIHEPVQLQQQPAPQPSRSNDALILAVVLLLLALLVRKFFGATQ